MKWQKNATIQVWRDAEPYQDEVGAWHEGRPYQLVTLWAYASGKDFSETYALGGSWVKPVMCFTVTRPRDETMPQVGDRVRYRGRWFEIKTMNVLTDTVGHDIRLICEETPGYDVA